MLGMLLDGSSPADDGSPAALYLNTTVVAATSTPTTPGPSTPITIRSVMPLDLSKSPDDSIEPPARPSSTPFPKQEVLDGEIYRLNRLEEPSASQSVIARPLQRAVKESSAFCQLPPEIHDCILDYLFGVRSSTSRKAYSAGRSGALRSWGTVLRHSRRREVSALALVSQQWRNLIQDRLYRHLKIKGTRDSIVAAIRWFDTHQHLCPHVKHIEIWFPVFQQSNLRPERTLPIGINSGEYSLAPSRSSVMRVLSNFRTEPHPGPVTYRAPSNNCTLEEVFGFVGLIFSEACILTLEGGDRKKPPMVRHFVDDEATSLAVLRGIKVLVLKGQWNLVRSNDDFQNIAKALPNLEEWHGSYSKPKSKSYICMATIFPKLPTNLTHVNICLEADYRREALAPAFWRKAGETSHICLEMAKAIPTLEYLGYTGRVCSTFFDKAAAVSNKFSTRLKYVDLSVKNVCRPVILWRQGSGGGSGITDLEFIAAFENLVMSAVRSLDRLSALDTIKIRYIDLGSPVPPLNPYFALENNRCTGVWSEKIVDELKRRRPQASYVELAETLGDVGYDKDGRLVAGAEFPKLRPLSIKILNYTPLAGHPDPTA